MINPTGLLYVGYYTKFQRNAFLTLYKYLLLVMQRNFHKVKKAGKSFYFIALV